MSYRPPTQPTIVTPESNFQLIDSALRRIGALKKEIDKVETLARASRDRLLVLTGEDGGGGAVAEMKKKHDDSANSQGQRLEKLSSRIEVLEKEAEEARTYRRLVAIIGGVAMLILGAFIKYLFDQYTNPPDPQPAPMGSIENRHDRGLSELTPRTRQGEIRLDYSARLSPSLAARHAESPLEGQICRSCT